MRRSPGPQKATSEGRRRLEENSSDSLEGNDGDLRGTQSIGGRRQREEEDGSERAGFAEESEAMRILERELENLARGEAPHQKRPSAREQSRWDSVLGKSAVVVAGEEPDLALDEQEGGGQGLSLGAFGGRLEGSPGLGDEDLQEGLVCSAIYPLGRVGGRRVEHFRVIHFGTLRRALKGRFPGISPSGKELSGSCPTVFWNLARIFHGEIETGIACLFRPSAPVALRRGSSCGRRPFQQKGLGDVFGELSLELIRDLEDKVPYFERNGIQYIRDPRSIGDFDLESVKAGQAPPRPAEKELGNCPLEPQSSRKSRRITIGVSDEKSVIKTFVDAKYRVVRFPIYDCPEKWKKVIYEFCILNNFRSCTLVKKDPIKGRCVIAGSDIRKDDFVLEYKGVLISRPEEARRLEELYAKNNRGCYMYYFKYNDRNYCIDATDENSDFGPGRLINHSRKNPNISTKVLMVGSTPRLFFVSKQNITHGEELLFDYGDNRPESTLHHPWLLNS
ncbi:histone lysine methyltransferase SET8 [Cryptosporidium felis]|nr:histone lysine methyltransferase SET8 [Cryptosporidium felis]